MQQISKETEEKILQLQLLEQNLQNFNLQKQKFQIELIEIDNALKELQPPQKEVYKIVGNIMIASKQENLKEELNSKKEIINLRVKNLEKQESELKEKFNDLQQKVINKLKNSK